MNERDRELAEKAVKSLMGIEKELGKIRAVLDRLVRIGLR